MRLGCYSADDVLVVRQVCFAALAPVDAAGVEIDVICEPHLVCFVPSGLSWLLRSVVVARSPRGCQRYAFLAISPSPDPLLSFLIRSEKERCR